VEDYTQKIIEDSVIGNRKCWKIELIPKPEAPVVWGKIYVWISKEDYLQLKSEFFDEDGELVSMMNMSEIKMMGGRLLPTMMEMFNVENPGNKTVIIYKTAEFDKPIPDSFFSEQNMKRVR
jgi:outer membrane lipoprotein-sorting protein